jgi:flagellar basal-body rod protein FlgB
VPRFKEPRAAPLLFSTPPAPRASSSLPPGGNRASTGHEPVTLHDESTSRNRVNRRFSADGTSLASSLSQQRDDQSPTGDVTMPLNLDQYVGVHAAALEVRSRRGELIANNLANADTPGYQARDIDFRQALARAGGAAAPTAGVSMTTTNAGHIGAGTTANAATDPDLKYRTPLAPALDGNTVDAQLEQAAFAENAVRYQATLTMLNNKFRTLLTAIMGS